MIFQSLVMILPRFSTLKDYLSPQATIKYSEANFAAMSMMNKCAKFHKDSLSGKKVSFNLPSAIELLETADVVKNLALFPTWWSLRAKRCANCLCSSCVCTKMSSFSSSNVICKTLYRNLASEQLRWRIWPTFPLNFFMKYSQKMLLYLLYYGAKKSEKMTKKLLAMLKILPFKAHYKSLKGV